MAKRKPTEELVNSAFGEDNIYEKYCSMLTLEQLFTTDSVYVAAKVASTGFMNRPDTVAFMKDKWANSRLLCQKVLNGSFKPRYYREIEIHERGKARIIKPPTFETKVVQKVICDGLIRPLLEPKMISTSYASIRYRGTDKMYSSVLESLNRYLKKGYGYIVTTDYKSYFASIDVNILFNEILGRYIKDKKVLDLSRSFSPEDRGLSLGNELSQIPASFFPSEFDHYIKDRLGLPYWRYMDDALAILKTKEDAEGYVRMFKEFAVKLNLNVSDKKIKIHRIGKDITFCKERYYFDKKRKRYYRVSNPGLVRNETKKIKAAINGKYPPDKLLAQYKGVRGSLNKRPDLKRQIARIDRMVETVREIAFEKTAEKIQQDISAKACLNTATA